MRASLCLPGLVLLAACGVSTLPQRPLDHEEEAETPGGSNKAIKYSHANDSTEISRSVGAPGGVVVLWPRIVPRSEDPATLAMAEQVESRLAALARKTAGDSVDKRPSPERVCPKDGGCRAASVGAVIAVKDKGCALVAVVSAPGIGPQKLVPWAGTVKLRSSEAPFREPPENEITVTEFVPCEKLVADLSSNAPPGDETPLETAISAAVKK
jgi:hypothetical protein